MKGLLVVLILGFESRTWAQNSDAAYAAPGMPIRVQRKVQLTSAVPRAPLVSPILPRYWHLADDAKGPAAQPVYRFISGHLKYPATTLAAGISGKLYVHLTVLATGAVARAVITRRELSKEAQGEYDGPANLGEAALDKELLRVVQTLRFEASKVASDTVTIVQIFGIQ